MNHNIKFTLIFRFFIALACVIIGYSWLHWQLLIKKPHFQVYQFLSHIAGPLLLTIIVCRLLLYSRIKLIKLPTVNDGTPRDNSYLMGYAVLLITASTSSVQYLVEDWAGGAQAVSTPYGIAYAPYARYYHIGDYQLDKKRLRVVTSLKPSRKRGRNNLTYETIVAIPIAASRTDGFPEPDSNTVWVCGLYSSSFNKALGKATIESRLAMKISEQTYWVKSAPHQSGYFQRPDNDYDLKKKVAALGLPYVSKPHQLLLERLPTDFESRYDSSLYWSIALFILAVGGWLLLILPVAIDEEKLRAYHKSRGEITDPLPRFRGFVR